MQRLSVKREDPLYKYTLDFMEHYWGTKGKGIFPGSQPISIEYRHFDILKSNPYVVCEKTDGVRFMMLAFMFDYKKKTIFVNRALEMFDCPLNFRKPVYEGTIVEGEMYGDTFMMYDMLMNCGEMIGGREFLTRLDHMEKFKKMLMSLKYDPIKLALKTFHLMSDYQEFMDKYLPTVQQEIDGLIFTPINDTVKTGTHETMFKWKPRDKNTIDFQLKRKGDGWKLYVQERGKLMFESEIRDDWVPSQGSRVYERGCHRRVSIYVSGFSYVVETAHAAPRQNVSQQSADVLQDSREHSRRYLYGRFSRL